MNSARRALISVSDKTGIDSLAQCLLRQGYHIVSTGGTAGHLRDLGFPVMDVCDVTRFPEILDGRVKTLHPAIHAGILANRSLTGHVEQLRMHGITPVDMVIVNLYPFRQTVENHPDDPDRVIENIDIGGPCLIRAAAKNYRHCTVVCDPKDYPHIIDRIESTGVIDEAMRRELAYKAFAHTAQYDVMIQSWFQQSIDNRSDLPEHLLMVLERGENLRYGENPHQKAAIYRIPLAPVTGLLGYQQYAGKELSFNNLLDTQAAWDIVSHLPVPSAAVIKHQNPCGAAVADTPAEACRRALDGDPQSAFGGIVALNAEVDTKAADVLHAAHFLEVIAAPAWSPEALHLLTRKKNRRLIQLEPVPLDQVTWDIRMIHNGALIQTRDSGIDDHRHFRPVTRRIPTEAEWMELLFGWAVCRWVKSNGIVLVRNGMVVGVGAGQMSRVDSVRLALEKAGNRANGAMMASDAFFPFRDGVEAAARAGIAGVIQPGGSKGDDDVIAACDEAGIAMVFTDIRHFRH
ncbi:bifunctional phosphoribosylaminoimidazolecarboxamide formyltransferase/IMP cyclohydrolase [bacterium]|nr:bifunctional phosphoribosylaminoimidazolecarboxamide formyltransferase/IMP cyclohydrolase [candidate division CSSED10-310 bacterium]